MPTKKCVVTSSQCSGSLHKVEVFGQDAVTSWGKCTYCDHHIKYDRDRGFRIDIVGEDTEKQATSKLCDCKINMLLLSGCQCGGN